MKNEDFFESLRQTITDTAEVVGKKTEDLVEIQKLRSRIRNAQSSMETDYKKLGEIIYQRYIGGAVLDEELADVCGLIMELQKETASYKEKLASRRGQNICPVCGNGNPRDAAFCMQCGAQIPKSEPETEDPYAAGPVQEDQGSEQEVWDACTVENEEEKGDAETESVKAEDMETSEKADGEYEPEEAPEKTEEKAE